jgi:hypothetical protein
VILSSELKTHAIIGGSQSVCQWRKERKQGLLSVLDEGAALFLQLGKDLNESCFVIDSELDSSVGSIY